MTNQAKRKTRLIAAMALTLISVHNKSSESIEASMTEQEFRSSGLYKLSQEERKFLNQWLKKNADQDPVETTRDEELPATTPNNASEKNLEREYQQAKAALNAPRELQIKGQFKGWSGDTYFFMTNGEIWQQRTNRRYSKKLDSPKVRIYKNKLGFFEMEVIETGKKVGVKRVQQD